MHRSEILPLRICYKKGILCMKKSSIKVIDQLTAKELLEDSDFSLFPAFPRHVQNLSLETWRVPHLVVMWIWSFASLLHLHNSWAGWQLRQLIWQVVVQCQALLNNCRPEGIRDLYPFFPFLETHLCSQMWQDGFLSILKALF